MSSFDAASTPFSFVLSERTRILVVDDDPIQREFASVYLSTPTTTVDAAKSAESGFELLLANAYDIALVDIDMPGMGGIEMVQVIRATPPLKDLPVVMVSGCEDILSIDRSYDVGATSFVTKPVNWRLLCYHLRFVLRSQRTERGGIGCRPRPSDTMMLPSIKQPGSSGQGLRRTAF
jgi:DNA-binding response OmpR family regulator